MRKYTNVEGQAQVLTPEQTKKVEANLHKIGKTSARNLSDEERDEVLNPEDE